MVVAKKPERARTHQHTHTHARTHAATQEEAGVVAHTRGRVFAYAHGGRAHVLAARARTPARRNGRGQRDLLGF